MNKLAVNKDAAVQADVGPVSLADRMAMRILEAPDISVDTLREVLKMQNEQEDRRRAQELEDRRWVARQEYNKAFNAVQKKLPQIVKNARNKHGNYDYATMNAIDAAITPIITDHGFGTTFREGGSPASENHMHVVIVLKHTGGHEEEYNCQVPIVGKGLKGNAAMTDTHGYGATKTYGRRYAKYDVWDLVVTDADTDGNINNQAESEALLAWRDRIGEIQTIEDADNVRADLMSDTTISALDRTKAGHAWTAKFKTLKAEDA